jgi:hypothetical protein
MRFMEIANSEDQLALWRLISDNVWGAFAQQQLQPQATTAPVPAATLGQGRAAMPGKPVAKHLPRPTPKASHKVTVKGKARAAKPKRAPMAPAPSPLPKPRAQQLSPGQARKQQTQQHQQLAQHLSKEITKPQSNQKIYPQPPAPSQKLVAASTPRTDGYDERDKDELVTHSRAQHPFKTTSQIKSALSSQKRGF